MNNDDIAARKSLLVAQADLERLKLAHAWRDARAVIAPERDPSTLARRRPLAARILGIAVPVLGLTRAAGLVRGVTLGLAAYRIVRNWRGGSRS